MNKQQITFKQVLPVGGSVTALLGDAPIKAKAGAGGGWEVIDRPKRKSFTYWNGYGPYAIDLQILFDGFAEDRSVEPEIEQLRRMMRVPTKATRQPAVIQVVGAIPLIRLRWVIQEIETGEEVRRSSDGARIRSFQNITLLEYVAGDVLTNTTASPSPAQKANDSKSSSSGSSGSSKTYTVKSGDTLWAIATRTLGSGPKWTKIADLNNIRDPKTLKIGTVLRLP